MTTPAHMPAFLQAIAEQARAYRQSIEAGDDYAALMADWRNWADQAAERIQGLRLAEEQATAFTGSLSPGCQACKDGAWDCIFLTMRCNLKCSFCCSPLVQQSDAPVSAFGPDVETIAGNYARSRINGISFSGGEPFFVPERLLDWVRAFRLRFPESYLWIYTNGLLVDPQTLEALARLNVNEIRFNAAASGYNHARLLANLRRSASIFPRVTVEIPAVPEDGPSLLAALPAWAEAGARCLNLHELMFEPGTRSAGLPGQRKPVRLPDGHLTEIHPSSALLALRVMEIVAREKIPLSVNYCSLLNKVGQVSRRRASLLPLTRQDYEQIIAGQEPRSLMLTSCVLYDGPNQYRFCPPEKLAENLANSPQYSWARISRLPPLALNDQGGWVEFVPGPDAG